MRAHVILFLLTFLACSAWAQDPGMEAAQATQQAHANDQAMPDAQQASQQAMQNVQPAAQPVAQCYRCGAATPRFSAKSGKYSGPVTVKMRDASRGAVIYYTTDGWTPTAESTRYASPVTIASTTTLQAIAISPDGGRSRVATAVYTVNGVSPAASVPAGVRAPKVVSGASSTARLVLARGMAVPFVIASDVSSKTAEVGDTISLKLAEDLKSGDVVVVKKGTPTVATVTEVERPGIGGLPGEVFFQVDTLQAGETVIRLRGAAAKEGQDKEMKAALIPAGFIHGKEAEIKQGAVFTAIVDADTFLPPAN